MICRIHCVSLVVMYWTITNLYYIFLAMKMAVGNSCVVKIILKEMQELFLCQKL